MTVDVENVAAGVWLLVAPNGVAFVLEDASATMAFGEGGRGWWLRTLRGPGARRRFRAHLAGEGSPVEMHEVGTFATKARAIAAAGPRSVLERREGIA